MSNSYAETIESIAQDIEEVEGLCILIAVTDDTELRKRAISDLQTRLGDNLRLQAFRYSAQDLSLLEGVEEKRALSSGRLALSVTGLETLSPDKQTEAIKLLNLQRNRLVETRAAILLWVNQSLLAEVANQAADFFSWRSATVSLEPPPDFDVIESARKSYLQALVYQNQYVNLQGLAPMRGGQIVQMQMEEIFIPLHAEAEAADSDYVQLLLSKGDLEGLAVLRETPEVRGEFDSVDAVVDEVIDRTIVRMHRRHLKRESQPRSVEITEMLNAPCAVVLGDPGSGKTTLLRFVAYNLAKSGLGSPSEIIETAPQIAACLPVYIRIGEFAQYLQDDPDITLDGFAPLACRTRQLPLSEALFKSELDKGRMLFLLDGLDEVIDTGQRNAIRLKIEQLAQHNPQCRVIVTSRLVGYRESRLGNLFAQFTIRPFGEAEIRQFAERWYAALEMPEPALSLVESVLNNDAIRKLAANPLLLTVIALIHYRGTKLPHQRVKLYQLAAETLVDQWMSARRVLPEGWNPRETIDQLLPEIGWHLHRETSSGLIGEAELHERIVQTLRRYNPRLSQVEAEQRALQFRRNVNEFSGIFLERGLDKDGRGLYGFLHLTFEEYFAAVRLADRWERERQQALKPILHEPRWQEVMLLAAGRFAEFSQYLSTEFVRNILEAGSEYEAILHRDLFLAARCLGDDIRVDDELRSRVLHQLMEIYFKDESPDSLREDALNCLVNLVETMSEDEMIAGLLERLSGEKGFVRHAAAEALGALKERAATDEIIHLLLNHLTDAEWSVRSTAARVIGGMGARAASDEVIRALLERFSDDVWYVRIAATRAIGLLGKHVAKREVIRALFRQFSDIDWDVRQTAAEMIGELGRRIATDEIIEALLERFSNDDRYVRAEAVRAIGVLGEPAATEKVIQALLERFSTDEWPVRLMAAEAISALGDQTAKKEVVQVLLEHLTDKNEFARSAAVEAMGKMGEQAATPEVINALLERLADDNRSVVNAAAMALGTIGKQSASAEIIHALLERLSDNNSDMRYTAAQAIGVIGAQAASDEVINTLYDMLSKEPLCYAAGNAIGKMGAQAAKDEIIKALLNWLSHSDMRPTAGEALKKLSGHYRPSDRAKMLNTFSRLAGDADYTIGDVGYVCLRNLLAQKREMDVPLSAQ